MVHKERITTDVTEPLTRMSEEATLSTNYHADCKRKSAHEFAAQMHVKGFQVWQKGKMVVKKEESFRNEKSGRRMKT